MNFSLNSCQVMTAIRKTNYWSNERIGDEGRAVLSNTGAHRMLNKYHSLSDNMDLV